MARQEIDAFWRGLAGALLLLASQAAVADEAFVRSRSPIGPYLAVQLAGGSKHALLVPDSEACARLSRPEARVRYVDRGFPGRIEAPDGEGELRCEAAGILDLERIRDRRPRPELQFAPRKTAFWTTIHRDGEHALLRGRFPLAYLVGIEGGDDLVAVVSDDGSCEDVVTADTGALEFRDAGKAFRLSAGRSRCHVLGFARPPPKRR